MRVAITGASGFIGSHLTAHLKLQGHDVLELGRDHTGTVLVPHGNSDLSNNPGDPYAYLGDVAGIVHLAARQLDSPATPFSEYLQSNVVMTESLLRAAHDHGVTRFVAASSRLVYPSSTNEPITEDCPHAPGGFYGLSKSVGEDLVRIYSAKGTLSGVALRIGQVFGDGDKGRGVLPRFIEGARRGQAPTVAGTGAAVRDFVYVKDVVTAFQLALENETTVPALNIGGGGHSIRELALTVARAAGMAESAVQFEPVDNEDMSHFSLDCTLANRQLGWAPAQSLLESVRERLAAPS